MMLPIGRHRRIVLPADFTLCNPKKLRYWKPSPSRPKPSPREELDAEWASVEHSLSELEHAVAAKEAEFMAISRAVSLHEHVTSLDGARLATTRRTRGHLAFSSHSLIFLPGRLLFSKRGVARDQCQSRSVRLAC